MRCPKCGYNQFDNPNNCSRCRADLSDERLRLNLPEGPLHPISLTEILAKVRSMSVQDAQPVQSASRIEPQKPIELKTIALDLSTEGLTESPTASWKVTSEEPKKKSPEGLSVDLTLE
jgi:hypothetical protein